DPPKSKRYFASGVSFCPVPAPLPVISLGAVTPSAPAGFGGCFCAFLVFWVFRLCRWPSFSFNFFLAIFFFFLLFFCSVCHFPTALADCASCCFKSVTFVSTVFLAASLLFNSFCSLLTSAFTWANCPSAFFTSFSARPLAVFASSNSFCHLLTLLLVVSLND